MLGEKSKRGLDGDIARDRVGLQLPAGKAVTDRLASQHGIGRHLRYAERLKIARIHTDTDLIAFFKQSANAGRKARIPAAIKAAHDNYAALVCPTGVVHQIY